jgi:hypothetical protein
LLIPRPVSSNAGIATFHAFLAAYHPRWKNTIGSKAAGLLEPQVGELGA